MKFPLLSLAVYLALGIANMGYAQSPTPSWQTLAAQAKAATDRSEAANKRLDDLVSCGRNGKLYAPGAAGADAQGCAEPTTANGVRITELANSLSALNSNVSSIGNNFSITAGGVAAIVECNQKGLIYNGMACSSPAYKPAECRLTTSRTGGSVTSCLAGATEVGTIGDSKVCMRVVCN